MFQDPPATLAEALRRGRVTPLVGAGVSMAVLDKKGEQVFPSWLELLKRAARLLENEGKEQYAKVVNALLDLPDADYVSAASYIRSELGSGWYRLLRRTFGCPRTDTEDSTLDLARAIWRLTLCQSVPLLVTTNYDRSLRWACPEQDDLESWDIQAVVEQVEAIRGELSGPVLWHLHGHVGNTRRIVLTHEDYRTLYPELVDAAGEYAAALTTLRSLLTARTFLFVGFSVSDPYFLKQIEEIHGTFQGVTGPHYVLVRKSEVDRVRSLQLPLEPIWFEDFGDPLLQLVEHLEGLACDSANTVSTTDEDGIERGSEGSESTPMRVTILIGHSLEDPLPEAVELATAAALDFARSDLKIELRVDVASLEALRAVAARGTDLLIYYGHGSEDGWLSFVDGRRPFSQLAATVDLERFWANLKACFVFSCYGDRFAQSLQCPWVAYSGEVLRVAPKTFLHALIRNLTTQDLRAAAASALAEVDGD